MKVISKKYLILATLVLGFGSVSCLSDKPTEADLKGELPIRAKLIMQNCKKDEVTTSIYQGHDRSWILECNKGKATAVLNE